MSQKNQTVRVKVLVETETGNVVYDLDREMELDDSVIISRSRRVHPEGDSFVVSGEDLLIITEGLTLSVQDTYDKVKPIEE